MSDTTTPDLESLFSDTVHGRYGVHVGFRDKDRANALALREDPSYALIGPGDWIHLVYLVKDGEIAAAQTLADELAAGNDGDAVVAWGPAALDDGQALHEADVPTLASGDVFHDFSVEKIEALLCETAAVEFYGDAEIRSGPINPDFLRKKVRVSRAPGKDQSYWAVSPEMPFGDVLAQCFTKHVAHEVKDNWATVFASLIEIKDSLELKKVEAHAKFKKAENGEKWPVKKLPSGYHWAQRTKNTVSAIYALGIDVDDGTSFEEAGAAVDALGYFALLYSTHSHGSTSLDFSYSKLRKWSERAGGVIEKEDLADDDVKAFLTAEGKYKPYVIASVRNVRWEQNARGIIVYADIDPIDKFRIVFLLQSPYVPSSFKMDFAAVETQWREIVLGVGAMLGVKPDKAATDLCRLFFEPRHHPKRPDAKIVIYAGDKLLDWNAVDRVKEEKPGKGGGHAPDRYLVEGIDLRVWAKHFAHAFCPTMMLDAHCDDRIRHRHDDSKFDVECPHDEGHSNVGDPADRGGFVVDAAEQGFVWGCQHDGCQSARHDRLDQIKKAIGEGWFGIDALTDPEFSNMVPEDFEAALAAFRKDNESSVNRAAKKAVKASRATGEGPVRINALQDFPARREELRAALVAANSPEPRLFQTKGLIRRLSEDDELEHVDTLMFKAECNTAATYVKSKKVGDSYVDTEVPVAPDDIDFLRGSRQRLFPELAGVRNAPVHSATGHLRTESGYDPDAKYLYQFDGLVIPPVRGTDEDRAKALGILVNDVLGDFPFSDDITGSTALTPFVNNRNRIGCETGKSSRAHALAAILHPFVTGLIDGPSPAYFFEKPEAGTGASLLAEVVALISTGRKAPMQTLTKPEELRKELMSKLVKGRSLIVLDNIPESGLRGDVLASFLTASTFSGRLLGGNEDVEIDINCQTIITGNHVEMEDDFVRRMLAVYMNAGCDPKSRKGFRHPQLLKWIKRNRSEIIWACLTLVQHWMVRNTNWSTPAEDEESDDAAFASYEEYERVMRGVLEAAGIDGFRDNAAQFKAAKGEDWQDKADLMQSILDKQHAKDPFTNKWPVVADAFWTGEAAITLTTADIAPIVYEDGLCKFACIDKSDRHRTDASIKNLLSRRLKKLTGKGYEVKRHHRRDEDHDKDWTSDVTVSLGSDHDEATNLNVWVLRVVVGDSAGSTGDS